MKNLALSMAALCMGAMTLSANEEPPFGGETDVAFAEALWTAINEASLAGENRINSKAFEGNAPHGPIQQVLSRELTVEGITGKVIVKQSHFDTTPEDAYAAPNAALGSYEVMFKREEGYDPDNLNWFWAKYHLDGSLFTAGEDGPQIAGRFKKGDDANGCIACHTAIGGEDLETLTLN